MSAYTEGLLRLKLETLQTEFERLRNRVPVRIGDQMVPQMIIIIGGNSLGLFNGITTYGIRKFNGTLSSVTTASYNAGTVNPSTGAETGGPTPAITAWPSGLGYGTRYNGLGYDRVFVVNDSRGTMATALIGGASDDTTYAPSYRQVRMLSQRQIIVTKADGSSLLAYSPDIG